MNNSQFRKLVLDTPARQANASSPPAEGQSIRNGVSATPTALGSRMRSSIPMTPRSIAGRTPHNDFARQLAERNSSTSQSQKKFRSSAAPKGAKLPQGYVDRAKQRSGGDEEEENDKVKRVKALEEMMKLQQIDEETFVKLREEILGDDVGAERAGLVKGLDWSLLERVRRGEVDVGDVLEPKAKPAAEEQVDEGEEVGNGEDMDDEFEKLEDKEVEAVVHEKAKKKGEMAPPALTGKKRNRDQILAGMKAARQAAKEAAQPSLGSRFKKVGEKRAESRIERDSKGREVLITIDEDGNEKRKVRKLQLVEKEPEEKGKGLLMPDKDAKPLGMEVPDVPPAVEEEDIDIFDDVGDDYDPLAGLDEDASEEQGEDGEVTETTKSEPETKSEPGSMGPPPRPKPAARNYFGNSKSSAEEDGSKPAALSDPVFMAALKKASSLTPIEKASKSEEELTKEARRKKMLQQDDRDAQDMDMGFGSSRFEDEEDFEEKKVKLSVWGGGDDDGDDEKGEGEGKRKRGPKKRKGDSNSAADVLKVMERRKAES
ncbi:uncharacterized protein LY89DRAFT_642948 [Mollisia scopiformis]|uniref:Uncharacterized protein n=1 Tax=Mollisia scopiformis TaxID=149040 RepID=A0A194XEG0_MOLSC|nr:uncharacterized protein LY89DRAFT_642948 [Mollisia scopiformis]KUJ18575.1 hypothetical protein LY89DRAFT_642948 [Mollisia scopiformis]